MTWIITLDRFPMSLPDHPFQLWSDSVRFGKVSDLVPGYIIISVASFSVYFFAVDSKAALLNMS